MSRCTHHVTTLGQCELADGHHGPCTVGRAQAWNDPQPCGCRIYAVTKGPFAVPRGCMACNRIDAAEVLRLHEGGELRPLQKAPSWLVCAPDHRQRRNMVTWARRILAQSEAA